MDNRDSGYWDISEQLQRCFIVAYSYVFVAELFDIAAEYCPMGCNYLDETTRLFVHKPNAIPNFASHVSYNTYAKDAHIRVGRHDVRNRYREQLEDCGLMNYEYDIYDDAEPFSAVKTLWKDDFEKCVFELLSE